MWTFAPLYGMKSILEALEMTDALEVGTSEIFTSQIFHH